jgi:hypothetical protein
VRWSLVVLTLDGGVSGHALQSKCDLSDAYEKPLLLTCGFTGQTNCRSIANREGAPPVPESIDIHRVTDRDPHGSDPDRSCDDLDRPGAARERP